MAEEMLESVVPKKIDGITDIKLINDNILVTELEDDLMVNGVVTMYDSDSPYMFCKVISASDEAIKTIGLMTDVIIIKRYAKEEFLPGYYFVSSKDVRGTLKITEYSLLKA